MITCVELKNTDPRLAQIHALSFDEAWDDATFDRLLRRDFHSGFALKEGPTNQSFVLLSTIMDEAEILTLATVPTARTKGYATILLRHAAKKLYDQGCKKLILEVAIDNYPALNLYERLGFKSVGRRKNYYKRPQGQSIDAQIMVLNLAQMVASTYT
jgi:ribosomal-protein-alanine N-acetyltransferase